MPTHVNTGPEEYSIWIKRIGYKFLEIEAYSTTIVSSQIQGEFIDSNNEYAVGPQEPYNTEERRSVEDATRLASLLVY
jgi:hypothetical protein